MGQSQQCDGLFCQRNSFSSGGSQPRNLTNIFFTDLLSNQRWESVTKSGRAMFKAEGKEIFMYQADLYFKTDPELLAISQEFAADNKGFLAEVSLAWPALVNS